MDAKQVQMQIAALLDAADVEHARVREAIIELQATGGALREEVKIAASAAVKEAFAGLQGDIERARGAMKWFSYRWVFIMTATLAAFIVLGFAWVWGSLEWQRHQVTALIEQKAALTADIAEMQVNAAALAKQGARIKIADCGGKLCIVASKHQTDEATDWHGIWNDAKTGKTFVIPNGY